MKQNFLYGKNINTVKKYLLPTYLSGNLIFNSGCNSNVITDTLIVPNQRTLNYFARGNITVRLVPSLTGLDSEPILQTNNKIFSFSVESNPVKLEVSHKVIPPPMVSVQCLTYLEHFSRWMKLIVLIPCG